MTRYDRWSRDNMPSDGERARIDSEISRTMAGVLQDARNGISPSASMIKRDADETPRPASGGTVELKPPPGIDIIDRMVEAQDRIDRATLVRQALETAEIERRLERTNPYNPRAHDPYKAKTSYDPLQAYDDSVSSCHREKKEK